MMMQKIFQILFLSLLLTSFLSILCGDESKTVQSPSLLQTEGDISVTSKTAFPNEITRYEFSNGLTLFVQQTHSSLATVRAYVRNTGSAYEGEWLGSGISHLTERIVFGGTTAKRPRAETNGLLEQLGKCCGAWTTQKLTGYYIDCSTRTISSALELLSSWMTNAAIDTEEFMQEKIAGSQEIKEAEDDPQQVISSLLMKTVYRETPFRHPVKGYPDRFLTLTQEDVKRFYAERYTPNNTIFFAAGNVKEDEIARQLASLYSGISRGPELSFIPQPDPPQIAPRDAYQEIGGKMFQINFAWPTVTIDDADAAPLDVLAVLLAGGNSARLNRKVRDEKHLGSAFSASSTAHLNIPGFFHIQAESEPKDAEAVQTEILNQLRILSESEPAGNELVRARKIAESNYIYRRETFAERSNSCIENYINTGNPNFDEEYLNRIRKVTPNDITRVSRKYFKQETQNKILITPFGMAPVSISSNRAIIDSDVEGVQIKKNKLRVLAKQSSAIPIVTIQVYMLSGVLADSEMTSGRTSLLAEMLKKGSKNYSKTAIEDYLDSIGGKLDFYAGRNTLSVKMTVLKEDYQKSLALLADILMNPLFPEEEFNKVKEDQLTKIHRRQSSPSGLLFETFANGLPENTPYHLQIEGTPESIKKCRLEDLKTFYRQILIPDRMVVSIFGDIDRNEAIQKVTELFGEIQAAESPALLAQNSGNQFLDPPDIHKSMPCKSGFGIAAWASVSLTDEKEYSSMTVLQTLLSERLSEELLREGLSNQIKAEQMTGPNPGYFYISFVTHANTINEVFGLIEKEIERIKGGDLGDSELARIKEQITASHPHINESLASQGELCALNNLFGFDYKYDERFAERISSVTSSDVIAAAQKYLNSPARFSVSPNEER